MEDPHVSWQIASKWWIFHGNVSSQECNKSVPGGWNWCVAVWLGTSNYGWWFRNPAFTSFLVGIPFFTRFFFSHVRWWFFFAMKTVGFGLDVRCALGFQTPGEEVLGPQKTYHPNTFSGGVWKTPANQLRLVFHSLPVFFFENVRWWFQPSTVGFGLDKRFGHL